MLKNKKFLYILLLLFLTIPVCLSITATNPIINGMKYSNNDSIELNALKYSSVKVTNKWNYSSSYAINELVISSNGEYILAQIEEYNISLFNKNDNETLWNYYAGSAYSIYSIAISAFGDYIVVGDEYNVSLFDNSPSTDKQPLWNFNSQDAIYSVAISPDGEYIVAGSDTGVYFFTRTPTLPKSYEWKFDSSSSVNSIGIGYDIYDDLYYIAAGNDDGEIILLNSTYENPKSEMWIYQHSLGGTVEESKLAMSKDGNYIAAVIDEISKVVLLNKSYSTSQVPMWIYSGSIKDIAISSDGGYVAVCDGNDYLFVLNSSFAPAETKTTFWEYEATGADQIRSVDISAFGDYVVAGTTATSGVHLFNNTPSQSKQPIWEFLVGHIDQVAISASGDYIAASGFDPRIIRLFYHKIPGLPIIFPVGNGNDDDDDDQDEVIPGYNIFIVIGIIYAISLIVILRKSDFFSKY